ncbi:DUF4221 domain-containing protein [Belliella sp. R4-6]|uniref:DUF4221 domain-containing protein n=1 Tax=Belliella alkalica TaxID=1730871 RepID=A0ABS9VCL9_9BACT|nr:DUF4221 family protein [Belliella alkalica]MCH7414118.1 DUF4221 domain-containing protein [Belliella alkalica]
MKHTKTLSLLFLIILYSCGQKGTDDIQLTFSYKLDTVMIDSKGKNLDLTGYITNSDLNLEESTIYLFNKFDHAIDEVNLDELEYVRSFPYDKEGPNGTSHINYIYALADDLFFIKGSVKSGVFDKNGNLLKGVDWSKVNEGDDFQMFRNELVLEFTDSMNVFALPFNLDRSMCLDVLSVNTLTKKRIEIDSEKAYQNNILEFDDDGRYYFLDPMVYLTSENGYVMVSHDFSHEIYIFNAAGELVKKVTYEPTLTPKSVKQVDKKGIVSVDILQNTYQGFLEQVKFSPPVWDKVNNRYLRLSSQRIFMDTKAEDAFLPQLKEIKVFLTVFDEDFNLISEGEVPELNSESVKYFAKDGKLWVCQSFSDELGFLVFEF